MEKDVNTINRLDQICIYSYVKLYLKGLEEVCNSATQIMTDVDVKMSLICGKQTVNNIYLRK